MKSVQSPPSLTHYVKCDFPVDPFFPKALPPSHWEGRPIDPAPLARRIGEVRRDYVTEARAHPKTASRSARLAERRKAITTLEFFRQPAAKDLPVDDHHTTMLLV